MLLRGNSDTSARLRRSKSSSSVRTRNVIQAPQRIDPGMARLHAITAAKLALARGTSSSDGNDEPLRSQATSTSTDHDFQALRRKQSVRFTGRNAVSDGHRSITRRQPPTRLDKVNIQCPIYQTTSKRPSSLPRRRDSFTALPKIESPRSTPSSYRRLRKAKSMFTPRKSPSVVSSHVTPTRHELSRKSCRPLSSNYNSSPKILASKTSKLSLGGLLCHKPIANQQTYDQDAAIQIARDQYLQQLQDERLKERPSFFSMNSHRKPQKAFRWTVRSSSSNSFGPGISSTPLQSSGNSETGIGTKARKFSTTLGQKIRQVFNRSSTAQPAFPSQHVRAQKAHFGDYLSTTSGVDHESPVPPIPDHKLIARISSRASLNHNLPLQLETSHRPGSIRSVQTGSTNGLRSRVTSWTNSTASSTMNRLKMLERKRLSIIQENGGPHEPSSSTGRMSTAARKGYEVFRKPLKSSNGRTGAPVDSQRVFSALQKQLDKENNRSWNHAEVDDSDHQSLRRTSQRFSNSSVQETPSSFQRANAATVRQITNQPDESVKIYGADGRSKSASLHAQQYRRDLFRSSSSSSTKRNANGHPQFQASGLTYQQIAEQNERQEKRPLREVKSTFFPSKLQIKRDQLSPYRRALRSSMEEDISIELENSLESRNRKQSARPHLLSPVGASSETGSVYSRGTSGDPKAFETVISLARSDSSGEPGSVIIANYSSTVEKSIGRHVSSSTKSSGEWKGWMASQVATLGNRNGEHTDFSCSSSTSAIGHRRENAQIHGDDNQVGGRRTASLAQNQPLAQLHLDTGYNHLLRHQSSVQELGRYPTRFSISPPVPSPASTEHGRTPSSQTTKLSGTIPQKQLAAEEDVIIRSSQSHSDHSSGRPKKTELSLRFQPSLDLRELHDSTNTSSSNHRYGTSDVLDRPKGHVRNRYSPERVARLRRMHSTNAIDPKRYTSSQDLSVGSQHHRQENQATNDLIPLPSPNDENACCRAGVLDPIVDGKGVGGQKMIEMFLDSRKNGNGRVLENSTVSPAFI